MFHISFLYSNTSLFYMHSKKLTNKSNIPSQPRSLKIGVGAAACFILLWSKKQFVSSSPCCGVERQGHGRIGLVRKGTMKKGKYLDWTYLGQRLFGLLPRRSRKQKWAKLWLTPSYNSGVYPSKTNRTRPWSPFLWFLQEVWLVRQWRWV